VLDEELKEVPDEFVEFEEALVGSLELDTELFASLVSGTEATNGVEIGAEFDEFGVEAGAEVEDRVDVGVEVVVAGVGTGAEFVEVGAAVGGEAEGKSGLPVRWKLARPVCQRIVAPADPRIL
jgi:hypothetical protein